MDDTSTAVAETPSTPAAAPSATPAPASTPTTDRPPMRTALETFNEAAKAQGKKTYGTKAAAAPVAPAVDGTIPEAPPAEAIPPARTGAVPTADHIKAVENARTKARADVEQEFRSTYGDPQQVREIVKWAQRAATDRRGFVASVLQEALADPDLAPWLRQSMGVQTATVQPPDRGSRADAPPPPDFQDAAGNQFYSAKQQAAYNQWQAEQLKAEIFGQMQPDLDALRAEREQAAAYQEQQGRNQAIAATITEARSWPYFDRFKAEIESEIRQMPLTDGHPASEGAVLRRAYDRVVLPKLSVLEQDRGLASTLNPASGGATSGIPKSVRAKDGGTMAAALAYAAGLQTR